LDDVENKNAEYYERRDKEAKEFARSVTESFMKKRAEEEKNRRKRLIYIIPLLLLFLAVGFFLSLSWSDLMISDGKILEKVESVDGLSYDYVPARTSAIVFAIIGFLFFIFLSLLAYGNILDKEPKEYLLLLKLQGVAFAGTFVLSFLLSIYQLVFNDRDSKLSDILITGLGIYILIGGLLFMYWCLSDLSK
jgi:protein-S-isoprenylcysteine O-methyltransferase Ste14